MLFSHLLKTQILRCAATVHPCCGYHWGNYDASSGGCCKMRDATITECLAKISVCKPEPFINKCYKSIGKKDIEYKEYPMKLLALLKSKEKECTLFKHDICYYEPSDKTRRYQRTWADCPLIWLRPRQVCYNDKEYYPVMPRRPRPPPSPPMTLSQTHAFHMALLCKANKARMGTKVTLKCREGKRPSKCKRELAPMPSFSECDQEYIKRYCPTECACKIHPNLCDMWAMYHKNSGVLKRCTEAIVGYCPFKHRARPLF